MADDAAEVRLILNAIDNASKTISGVTGKLSTFSKIAKGGQDMAAGLGINLNALSNPAMAAGQGIKMVADYVKGAVDDTMAYTQAVKEMSMSFAAAPEEISRMIQAGDDMGVEMGEMRTAMLMMTKNGLAPTIDSLAALADRTNLITDPTKRADELVKLLGRSYTKLDPLLKQGGNGIRALAAAQSDGLVITEEEIKQSEALRVSMDTLNDKKETLTMTIGGKLIPIVNGLLDGWLNLIGGIELVIDKNEDLNNGLIRTYNTVEGQARASDQMTDAIIRSTRSYSEYIDRAEESTHITKILTEAEYDIAYAAVGAIKETISLADANATLVKTGNYERDMFVKLNDVTAVYAAKTKAAAAEQDRLAKKMSAVSFAVGGPLTSAYEGYWSTMGDLTKRADELYAKMEYLRRSGRGNSDEALALKQEYDGLIPKMDEAAAAMEEATAQMIYQQAAAGLDADAALELGRAMGIIDESSYNLATAVGTLNDKFDINKDGIINADEAADGYIEAMTLLRDAAKDGVLTLDEVRILMEKLDGTVADVTINVGLTGPGAGWSPPAGGGLPPGKAPKQTAMGDTIMPGEVRSWNEPGYKGELLVTQGGGVIVSAADIKAALAGAGGGFQIGSVNIYAAPGQNGAQLYDEFVREARKRQNSGAATAGSL